MSKKLKLTSLSETEMKKVSGGQIVKMYVWVGGCGCGCHYAGSGGSSFVDNTNANIEGGLYSPT